MKLRNFKWESWRVTFARLSWSFESSLTCLDARNTNNLPLIVNRFLRCKFLKILKCDQYTFWPNVSFIINSSVERNLIWGNVHQQTIGDVIYWIFIITWHFLKIVSPFVCFSACCFRFNGFSFIYLCCLLAIPLLPNPSRGLRVLQLYYWINTGRINMYTREPSRRVISQMNN